MAVLLGITMLGSLLAGCGSPQTGKTQQEASTQESSMAAEEASGVNAEASSEGEETGGTESSQASGETAHLTVEVFDRGNATGEYGSATDNQWTRWIQDTVKEELNIEVEFVAIPRSEETTKLSALIAAKQEPDIFCTYDVNFVQQWAADGVLADLTDYIETDGQDLKEYLKDVMVYGQMGEDKRQYALSGRRISLSSKASFIRKDWLDQLGIEVKERNGAPSMTPSELKNALTQMKEAGLCEYPFGMFGSDAPALLMGAFVSDEEFENEESRAVANYDSSCATLDGGKDGYRFLNECYNAGLINPDFALYAQEDLGEWVASSQCGFWTTNWWDFMEPNSNIEALYEAEPEAEIIPVLICNEDGSAPNSFSYAPNGIYLMVSSECEDVSAAVKYLNWLVSDEAHVTILHGFEGEHWEYDENMVMQPIDTEYNAETRKNMGDLDLFMVDDPCMLTSEEAKRATQEGMRSESCLDLALESMDVSMIGTYIPVVLSRTPQSTIDWSVELTENRQKAFVDSVMAPEADFDQTFDERLNAYLEEGFNEVEEEVKQIYAEDYGN